MSLCQFVSMCVCMSMCVYFYTCECVYINLLNINPFFLFLQISFNHSTNTSRNQHGISNHCKSLIIFTYNSLSSHRHCEMLKCYEMVATRCLGMNVAKHLAATKHFGMSIVKQMATTKHFCANASKCMEATRCF